jgi:lipoprotein-anchoring transpeptidase ErfK/SrfK
MKRIAFPWTARLAVLFFCLAILSAPGALGQDHAAPETPSPPPTSAAEKRVEIDKSTQTLRAYEGDRLVLESPVSTGKEGKNTPNGHFTAGVKQRMHHSRLYHNAPMPFSVQLAGNYFIHGFSSVPHHPASHGCIRLPLNDGNPAKKFFDWVDPGTPIDITGKWRK